MQITITFLREKGRSAFKLGKEINRKVGERQWGQARRRKSIIGTRVIQGKRKEKE